VLVTPVTQPEVTSVHGYFPKGTWYNLFDHKSKLVSGGEHIEVSAPLDSINVHVHEGTVLPMQENALTSAEVMSSPFTLLVAFSSEKSSGFARGKLFIDNGDDVEMVIRKGRSSFVSFVGQQSEHRGGLTSKVVSGDYAIQQGLVVQNVVILGVNAAPLAVTIDGKLVDSPGSVAFDADVPSLTVSGLRLSVGIEFELEWTTPAAAHSSI